MLIQQNPADRCLAVEADAVVVFRRIGREAGCAPAERLHVGGIQAGDGVLEDGIAHQAI
jgi:hypothetical protein